MAKAPKTPKRKPAKIKKPDQPPAIIVEPEVIESDAESASSSALIPQDALQIYLNEIRRYPLLTPEQEHELAVKYHKTGDRAAAERLVTSNLRFVVKIAAEYSRFGARMIDLIQEGNVGLMQAVKEFNPYKGVRLITYAVWWIRGYIQEYLMKNYSQVKIGTTQAQKKLFYHLNRERARLEALGAEADVKLLSSKLGVSEQDFKDMQQRMSHRDVSVDSPQAGEDESGRRWIDSLADTNDQSIEDQLASEEERDILNREIKKITPQLNEKERYILEKRVLGDPPLTLQEIGDVFKITRERARQLEERVLEKIKEHFKGVFPDYLSARGAAGDDDRGSS